jgi:hypothetical protein
MSIWLPVDFYFSLSRSRKRLLEVPTVMLHSGVTRAVRIECCILLHICLIIDFSLLNLNQFCSRKAS